MVLLPHFLLLFVHILHGIFDLRVKEYKTAIDGAEGLWWWPSVSVGGNGADESDSRGCEAVPIVRMSEWYGDMHACIYAYVVGAYMLPCGSIITCT